MRRVPVPPTNSPDDFFACSAPTHLRWPAQRDSFPDMALDEMVDGKGGLRPHWRSLLGVLTGLGRSTLVERAERLERIATEEGVSNLLPAPRQTLGVSIRSRCCCRKPSLPVWRPVWRNARACWTPC